MARKIAQANASMKAGGWEKKTLKGVELCGKTLGVVRPGAHRAEVAKRSQGFG